MARGRKKNIKSPEMMWDLFEQYRKHCKSNPIKKMEYRGKDAKMVFYELERPLTIEGFENFVADLGIMQDMSNYFANSHGAYENFTTICKRIRRVVRDDQIAGGMAGIYNPSITQRLNNLVDKQETTIKEQPLFGKDV